MKVFIFKLERGIIYYFEEVLFDILEMNSELVR